MTRYQNPNDRATLIMFMTIGIVRLVTAGSLQALTSFVIAVIINLEPNAVKVKCQPQSVLKLTQTHLNKIVAGRLRKYHKKIEGLECHLCRVSFKIGDEVASKRGHSTAKRTYYHPSCARLIHLLD